MNLYPILDELKIQHRTTGVVSPWVRNWAQEEYIAEFHRQWNANRPVRIIVLKARQLGISTATGGLMFSLGFVIPDFPSLIIAHEMDGSEHLLGISKRYWETFPYHRIYTPQYLSRKHLAWRETGSSIQVVTAKNEKAGRSRTLRGVHGSEVGFWDDASTLMLGLRQTVPQAPGTFIALESTANGVGNYFYDTWYKAVSGDSEFVPLFFPWWRHYEYRASYIGIDATRPLTDLSEEERALQVLMRTGGDGREPMTADDVKECLWWRRWAVVNLAEHDLDQFHQEYPATPEEAFVSSGRNVFPIGKLGKCYERKQGARGWLVRDTNATNGVRFQPDVAGPLTIFSYPAADRDWGIYFVGGDPTGTTRGDRACIQVINRRTSEQVAVWHGRMDPVGMAREMAKIGYYYNRAMVTTEATGPGYSTIGALIEMDYPFIWKNRSADREPGAIASNYGFNTTSKSKDWWVGNLLKLVVDGDVTIHDPMTFDQMRNYVTLDDGGYGPASDKGYDDAVAALAITCLCSATEGPMLPYGADTGPKMTPPPSTAEAIDPSWWEAELAENPAYETI